MTPEIKKQLIEGCIRDHCNPTCKGTLFQNGKNFPKNLNERINGPLRKLIFKNKISVLNNGFYEGLNIQKIKNLKEKGALSACIPI